jgi:hypothetical protein
VRVARILQPHQLDLVREVLVQHRVVENDITMDRELDLRASILPYYSGCQPVVPQVVIEGS